MWIFWRGIRESFHDPMALCHPLHAPSGQIPDESPKHESQDEQLGPQTVVPLPGAPPVQLPALPVDFPPLPEVKLPAIEEVHAPTLHHVDAHLCLPENHGLNGRLKGKRV